jgi:hypothetical protein
LSEIGENHDASSCSVVLPSHGTSQDLSQQFGLFERDFERHAGADLKFLVLAENHLQK